MLSRWQAIHDVLKNIGSLLCHIVCVMDVGIHGGRDVFVAKPLLYCLDIRSRFDQACGMGVPLRYNYDKPEKPRRIKDFEVFSLVFSSFFKPKNQTEISRIIGGVSLTTNE